VREKLSHPCRTTGTTSPASPSRCEETVHGGPIFHDRGGLVTVCVANQPRSWNCGLPEPAAGFKSAALLLIVMRTDSGVPGRAARQAVPGPASWSWCAGRPASCAAGLRRGAWPHPRTDQVRPSCPAPFGSLPLTVRHPMQASAGGKRPTNSAPSSSRSIPRATPASRPPPNGSGAITGYPGSLFS
jgi:hypothetical protein